LGIGAKAAKFDPRAYQGTHGLEGEFEVGASGVFGDQDRR